MRFLPIVVLSKEQSVDVSSQTRYVNICNARVLSSKLIFNVFIKLRIHSCKYRIGQKALKTWRYRLLKNLKTNYRFIYSWLVHNVSSIGLVGPKNHQQLYRVVKRNCQVVSFHNFGHISARMAQNFGIASNLNIFQLIPSKTLGLKAKKSPES